MTTTETPDAELTPELIDRVKKLSPENRDLLIELLAEEDLPPASDDAAFRDELRRRVQDTVAGGASLSRDESDAAIRAALRAQGVEL